MEERRISRCTLLNMLSFPNSISNNIFLSTKKTHTQNLIQTLAKTSTENVEPNTVVFVKPNVNALISVLEVHDSSTAASQPAP